LAGFEVYTGVGQKLSQSQIDVLGLAIRQGGGRDLRSPRIGHRRGPAKIINRDKKGFLKGKNMHDMTDEQLQEQHEQAVRIIARSVFGLVDKFAAQAELAVSNDDRPSLRNRMPSHPPGSPCQLLERAPFRQRSG